MNLVPIIFLIFSIIDLLYSDDRIYRLKYGQVLEAQYQTLDDYYFSQEGKLTFKTVHIDDNSKIVNIEKKLGEDNVDQENKFSNIFNFLKLEIKYLHVFESHSRTSELNILYVTYHDKVFGKGDNEFGVLGLGHDNCVKEAQIIPQLCDKNVVEFYNGFDFVLCLTIDNNLYGWGNNLLSQLGTGQITDKPIREPTLIEYFKDKMIRQVCCGNEHSAVLTSDGIVNLWGYYNTEPIETPKALKNLYPVKLIHCTQDQKYCVTKSENVVICDVENCSLLEIPNIIFIGSSSSNIFFISSSKIFIFEKHITCETKPKSIIDIDQFNYNAISTRNSCILYDGNLVYELTSDKCVETKYRNPFNYYSDKFKMTYKTIYLENTDDYDLTIITFLNNISFLNKGIELDNIFKPFPIADKILGNVMKWFIQYFHVFDDINGYNMLFVTNDDNVYGFGSNQYGCCGLGHNSEVSDPQHIPELCHQNVTKFFFGLTFAFAMNSNNVLYAWGRIGHNEEIYAKPIQILEFEGVIKKYMLFR